MAVKVCHPRGVVEGLRGGGGALLPGIVIAAILLRDRKQGWLQRLERFAPRRVSQTGPLDEQLVMFPFRRVVPVQISVAFWRGSRPLSQRKVDTAIHGPPGSRPLRRTALAGHGEGQNPGSERRE